MSRVDHLVTTMNRPEALERLLLSIARQRPKASVHVADQSESVVPGSYDRLAALLREAGLRRPVTVHRLPFDCGVSVARNCLAEATSGEYKLLLDDDFVFTARTDVDALARLLDAHPRIGVVGGAVTRGGRVRNVGTRLRRHGAALDQVPADEPWQERAGVRCRRVDCVPMFALVRSAVLERVRWDPELKTAAEHFDFYLRLAETTEFDVLYAPDVSIDHPPAPADPAYRQLRLRGELLKRMMVKHGLARLSSVGGIVTELRPDGELIRYCELPRVGS